MWPPTWLHTDVNSCDVTFVVHSVRQVPEVAAHLQDGERALQPAREQAQLDSVEQRLHQLEGQHLCDSRRRLGEEELQQTLAHVVFPFK